MTSNPYVPVGRLDTEPAPAGPYPTVQERLDALRGTLRGVDLGAYDERLISWAVRTLDNPTLRTLASWIERARGAERQQAAVDVREQLEMPAGDPDHPAWCARGAECGPDRPSRLPEHRSRTYTVAAHPSSGSDNEYRVTLAQYDDEPPLVEVEDGLPDAFDETAHWLGLTLAQAGRMSAVLAELVETANLPTTASATEGGHAS